MIFQHYLYHCLHVTRYVFALPSGVPQRSICAMHCHSGGSI